MGNLRTVKATYGIDNYQLFVVKIDKIVMKRKFPCKWTFDMEKKLMAVWKDYLVDLRTGKRTSRVYVDITARLGITCVTSKEVHVKIQNMTKRYRKEKAKVGTSGGQPSDWVHYSEMNEMLGSFSSNIVSVKEELFGVSDEDPLINYCKSPHNSLGRAGEVSQMSPVDTNKSTTSTQSNTCASKFPLPSRRSGSSRLPPRSKKKKKSYKFLDIVVAELEAARKDSEKIIELVGGLADNLSKILESQDKFNIELLQLLKSKNYTSDR